MSHFTCVFFSLFPGGSMARKGRERTANVRWRVWLVSNWLQILPTHLYWGSSHWLVPFFSTGRPLFCFLIHASLSNNTADSCTLHPSLKPSPPLREYCFASTPANSHMLLHCSTIFLIHCTSWVRIWDSDGSVTDSLWNSPEFLKKTHPLMYVHVWLRAIMPQRHFQHTCLSVFK